MSSAYSIYSISFINASFFSSFCSFIPRFLAGVEFYSVVYVKDNWQHFLWITASSAFRYETDSTLSQTSFVHLSCIPYIIYMKVWLKMTTFPPFFVTLVQITSQQYRCNRSYNQNTLLWQRTSRSIVKPITNHRPIPIHILARLVTTAGKNL